MANLSDRRGALGRVGSTLACGILGLHSAKALGKDEAQTRLQDFVDGLVKTEKFPGVSLAVADSGKLVHAVAGGMVDPSTGEAATPNHLFRIASLSKPLTGILLARILEKGQVKPETKIHDYLGLKAPQDDRWKMITVEHCLHHMGGWDRDKSFDPMFRSPTICKEAGIPGPAMPQHIIQYMLGHPLDFDPGARYAYSNFGYSLLGRVAEKATGLSYEQASRNEVLRPLGIGKTMALGKTLAKGRAPQEVRYLDAKGRKGTAVMGPERQVDQPYGCWCLEAMDAHGGWIATAPALVRWAVSLDKPGLLQGESLKRMWARPPGTPDKNKMWYGWGWQVREVKPGHHNTWHTGSLPGTGTILVRRQDGLAWALLVNTNANPEGKGVAGLVDGLIHQAVDGAKPLAKRDLFPEIGFQGGA